MIHSVLAVLTKNYYGYLSGITWSRFSYIQKHNESRTAMNDERSCHPCNVRKPVIYVALRAQYT